MAGKKKLITKSNYLQGTRAGRAPTRIKRTIKRTWGLSVFFSLKKWKTGFQLKREVLIEEEIELEMDEEVER